MECEVCKRSAQLDGVALFRQNEYGVIGVWRCREHNEKIIKPEVDEIVKAIELITIESEQVT